MRRLVVLSILAIFFVVFLTPILTQKSFADVNLDFQGLDAKMNLSGDRWKLKSTGDKIKNETGKLRYGMIDDAEDEANTFFVAQLTDWSAHEISAWAQKHIDSLLKQYSGEWGYEVNDKKIDQAVLRFGHEVTIVKYDLDINGNNREVRFVYFASTDNRIRYFLFIFNEGWFVELDESTKIILDSITLIE